MKHNILYLLLLLQSACNILNITAGNTLTKSPKPQKKTISELLSEKNKESNNYLKSYFTQNKQLIHYRSTEEIKNKGESPIGLPLYLALLHNNDEMINWLLDNGAELNNKIFLTLFLQKALIDKTHFFAKNLDATLKKRPEIITQKMSFYGEKLTPLEYATKIENIQAIKIIKAAQQQNKK